MCSSTHEGSKDAVTACARPPQVAQGVICHIDQGHKVCKFHWGNVECCIELKKLKKLRSIVHRPSQEYRRTMTAPISGTRQSHKGHRVAEMFAGGKAISKLRMSSEMACKNSLSLGMGSNNDD